MRQGGDEPGPRAPDPLFVGGSGRSGTHAMARLLDKHPAFHYFRRELRFHTDRGGFPDLLAGRTTADEFVDAMRGHFWRRVGRDGKTRGLYDNFERDAYDAALDRFRSRYDADPHAACRGLMNDLLCPFTRAAGKATWLEQTPPTVEAADSLYAIFPDMKLINMVRDGRDVACSVVGRGTGPDTVTRALERWELRLRAGHAAISRIPDDRHLTVQLEALVRDDRAASYRRLMSFLGVESNRKTRAWFKAQMSPEAANLGRWQRDLSKSEQHRLSRLYRRSLERMKQDRITTAPALSQAEMPAGGARRAWADRVRAPLAR